MKVAFVATTHPVNDDRIFYHQAKTLCKAGFEVQIIALHAIVDEHFNNLSFKSIESTDIKKKANEVLAYLSDFNPDVIVCSEPTSAYFSWKYKNKCKTNSVVIYDITEWYPSKKQHLTGVFPVKAFKYLVYTAINYIGAWVSNAFIFGEYYKAVPFKVLFPFKKAIELPYYSSWEYFANLPEKDKGTKFTLCYTGKLTEEKGFVNFLKAVEQYIALNGVNKIRLKIIGWFPTDDDANVFETFRLKHNELEIVRFEFLSYYKFIEELADVDLCFDLRIRCIENNHALPIKLFNYLAAGKPVVYSDLKAIRQHMSIDGLGYLVNPADHKLIADIIKKYTEDGSLYKKHSDNARNMAKTNYNWDKYSDAFVNFINEVRKK